jgi:ubiquitin C-terminal hydrolase
LALKQLEILRFPNCLIIQIIRFKNGTNGKVKNNEPIVYEEYERIGNNKYRLLSVILHEGSIEGGHYEAICRRGDSFYLFNDGKITKTNKIINKNAYIFCY